MAAAEVDPVRAAVLSVRGLTLVVDWSKATAVEYETAADVRECEPDGGWVRHEFTGRRRLVLTAEFDGNPFEWVPAV